MKRFFKSLWRDAAASIYLAIAAIILFTGLVLLNEQATSLLATVILCQFLHMVSTVKIIERVRKNES